jgi:hypothetical protein
MVPSSAHNPVEQQTGVSFNASLMMLRMRCF